MARITYDDIHLAEACINPLFRNTPQFECETLGTMLGCRVFLKVETLNPVRSFKGRGADLLTYYAKEKVLMCASAGNFGQAMAWCCRKLKIKLTVYASVNANQFKVSRMMELGAEVILEGEDFDAAKSIAKAVAKQKGIRFVEDSLDIETVAGAGTIGVELFDNEMFTDFDRVLVPLGNGALVNGIAMAARGYQARASIIAVQSANAPAMINSFKSKAIVTHGVDTIADGIAVRVPVPDAVTDMIELVDGGLLVKEETIIKAMQLLRLHAGILVEPSAAVGLAALLENSELFARQSVVLILTGSNLTEQQMEQWF